MSVFLHFYSTRKNLKKIKGKNLARVDFSERFCGWVEKKRRKEVAVVVAVVANVVAVAAVAAACQFSLPYL